jgi:23S rRNA (adenine2503-C2)-methyltransferase
MDSFYGYTRFELTGLLEKPRRAARLYEAVYRERISDFANTVAIPERSREGLAGRLSLGLPALSHRVDSADGTRRYLLCLHDAEVVESVSIPREDRVTFCISSQVGCALACAFCLTGKMGLTRDLSAAEMVSQVLLLERDLPAGQAGNRFSIVFMGMGEPLQNYDNVLKAIRILHDDHGLRIPMGRITLSTAGLLPGIERLASEPLFPNLTRFATSSCR